jgi:hypothetical protein
MTLIILMLTMLMMGMAIPVPEPATSCESGYSECGSRGAFTLFDDFVHLYQNLVDTVDASDHFKREPLNAKVIPPRAAATLLCCEYIRAGSRLSTNTDSLNRRPRYAVSGFEESRCAFLLGER